VFSDGRGQLWDGGEIQLAADHDRCHRLVALHRDREYRSTVGLRASLMRDGGDWD
jgi:hypothetical protein